MRRINSFFVFLFLACSGFCFSPTSSFLEEFPLSDIQAFVTAEEHKLELEPFLGLFQMAIAQEEPGFFGYHATTLRHWVFQQIVQQVLLLEDSPSFPKDYYLLRAPKSEYADFKDITAFLDHYKKRNVSPEQMKKFISWIFLTPLGKPDLVYDDQQAAKIYNVLAFPEPPLSPEATKEALVDFIGDITLVEPWLNGQYNPEEIPSEEQEQMMLDTQTICDVKVEQQERLISLNISLFGNFSTYGDSSIDVFACGKSITRTARKLMETDLEKFLQFHGWPEETSHKIFEEAQKIINLDQGVLLQFFDDPTYSHLDQFAYVCEAFGTPLPEFIPSQFLTTFDPTQNTSFLIEEKKYWLHPQIRLLITEEILLPSSWLGIKQYDQVPSEKKIALKKLIKEHLEQKRKAV